jgi:hypothetical protein
MFELTGLSFDAKFLLDWDFALVAEMNMSYHFYVIHKSKC